MRIRRAEYSDCEFIALCHEVWPESRRGRVFPVDVRNWIKIWRKTSNTEEGLIGMESPAEGEPEIPVGFLLISLEGELAEIHGIAVPEDLQGNGYARGMWRELKSRLIARGVTSAEFDALPGPIADKVEAGDFVKLSEGTGKDTGLPTKRGRVTADMEV